MDDGTGMADTGNGNGFDMHGTVDTAAVRATRERLIRLVAETADDTAYASKEHLERCIRELSGGIEELLVAEGELRVQSEELAASAAAIDAERERYGELFDFAPDAYLVTDAQGRILEANGAASAMLGVPARYLEGKLLVSFVDESSRRDLRDLLSTLSGSPQPVEERYLRIRPRDSAAFVAEVRAVGHVQDGVGAVRWMVRDVTQRLRLEEEIRFLHSEVELLTSLGRVARLTAEPQSVEAMLGRVVELGGQALPECDVSVALSTAGGARFPASSGDRGRRLDAAEAAQGDGPCLTAVRRDEVVQMSLEQVAQEWPAFGAIARQVGLVSAWGYPLASPGGQRGSLNVYAFAEVSGETRGLIPLLVDHVVVALTNAELYEGAHSLAGHLQKALESRGVIEQAKGVLIARQRCTDEEAFDILRRASQRLNRKLRDVAAELVAHVQTGEGAATHPPAAAPFPIEGSLARRGREMRPRQPAADDPRLPT